MVRFQRIGIGVAAALLAATGCEGGGAPSVSSSSEEAVVRGTVTVKGQAPANAEITFDPTNINRKEATPRSAKISANGNYELKTLVGENSVSVHGPEIDKDPQLSVNQKMIEVKSGDNSVPIEIP